MHITSFFFHSKIFLHAPNTQIVRAQIATVHAVRLTRWFEMKNQSLNSCLRWWKKRFHSFIRSFVYNWPRPWSHLCVVFATGIRIPTHRLEAFFNFWTLIGSFLLWNTLFFHDFLLSPVAAVRQQFSVAEFLNFSIWINSNEIGITKITLSGAIVNRNNANCILHFSRPTVSNHMNQQFAKKYARECKECKPFANPSAETTTDGYVNAYALRTEWRK